MVLGYLIITMVSYGQRNYKDGISDGYLEEYSFGGQLRLKGNHQWKMRRLWEWFTRMALILKLRLTKMVRR